MADLTMRRRVPACGNTDAHPAHEYGTVYDANSNRYWPKTCGGQTEHLAAAAALAAELDAAVLAWWEAKDRGLSPRLRLECHVSVVSALTDLAEPDFITAIEPGGVYGLAAYAPLAHADVVVMPMPPGEWRLTAPGEVLASGTLGELDELSAKLASSGNGDRR